MSIADPDAPSSVLLDGPSRVRSGILQPVGRVRRVANGAVLHVLLYGGSCSGKTHVSRTVAELLRERGVRTMLVSEGAAAAMKNGLGDLPVLPTETYEAVQAVLALTMHLAGRSAHELATAAGGGVVIHDRGPLDALAYAPWDLVEAALTRAGTTIDGVLHSFDVAIGLGAAPYETDSNIARYETAEVAADRDSQIRLAWSFHPHKVNIPFQPDISMKVMSVLHIIESLIRTT